MKKWLTVVWIACCAGVIWTCFSGREYYHYCFAHHLYNLGFRAVATDMDILSAKFLVVFAALYAGIRLWVWVSRVGNDRIGAFLPVIALRPHVQIPDRTMVVLGVYFNAAVQLVRDQIGEILPAILVLALGIGLLTRLRGRNRAGHTSTARAHCAWLDPAMRRILAVTERSGRILWPFAAVLVAINILAMALFVQRNLSLRDRPNVIMIMADTVRADHLGCYGYSRNTTPNLDRLAHDGIRFEDAISQAPLTVWSVPSFMSSSYPDSGIPEGVTIQEFLADRGYTTGGIVSNLSYYGDGTNVHRRFDYWDGSPNQFADTISSPFVLSSALKWLNKVQSRKFFMFALFIDPHSPYTKHKGYDFDPEYHGVLSDRVYMSMENTKPYMPPPCDVGHMKALYDSEIAYTDAHIGELINRLKKDGLYDKSLVVFLSDHGEEFRDHGAFFHMRTLYRELLHVPLIVKLPGHHQGKIVTGNFSMIDLFPSIVCQLGYGTQGLGLSGEPVNLRTVKYLPDKDIFSANDVKNSIWNSTYKLVVTQPTTTTKEMTELYCVAKDKEERVNVSSTLPNVVNKLRRIMLSHEQQIDSSAKGSMKQQEDIKTADDARKMKALGYLQ